MRFFFVFIAMLAMLVDFFLARPVSGARLNIGFLVIVFLCVRRKYQYAFIAALSYGFFLDIFSSLAPFGTFIIAHLIVFSMLKYASNIFSGASNSALVIAIFLSSIAYLFILGVFQYVAINMFTRFSVDVASLFSIGFTLKSALISCALSLVFIALSRFSAAAFGKWFYVRQS